MDPVRPPATIVMASYGQSSEHCVHPVQKAGSTNDGAGRTSERGLERTGTTSRPPQNTAQTARLTTGETRPAIGSQKP
jgi:hypothetical protein